MILFIWRKKTYPNPPDPVSTLEYHLNIYIILYINATTQYQFAKVLDV